MWAPLRDQSPEWIVPGLSEIENDSLGLLVPNQRFIEAYMVGLNHEMVRELHMERVPVRSAARRCSVSSGRPAATSRVRRSQSIRRRSRRASATSSRSTGRTASLGTTRAAGAATDSLVLLVRAELFTASRTWSSTPSASIPRDADHREVPCLLRTARSGRRLLRLRAVRLGRPRLDPRWFFVRAGAARGAAVPRPVDVQAAPGTYLTPDQLGAGVRPPRTSRSRRFAIRSRRRRPGRHHGSPAP